MKAQNPYEGHFERAFSDGSPDRFSASQNIAGELPSLAFMSLKGQEKEIRELSHDPRFAMLSPEQIRQMMVSESMANRDKFSFVSAALCGPLFLFGMGAAFALFDDIKQAREAKLQQMLSGKPGTDGKGAAIVAAVKGETNEETKLKAESTIARPKPLSADGAKLLGFDSRVPGIGNRMLGRGFGDAGDNRRPRLDSSTRADVTGKVKAKLYGESEQRTWEEKAAQRSLKSWLKAEVLLKRKQSLLDHMERVRGKEQFGAYAGLAAKLEVLDKALKRMGFSQT